MHLSNLKSSTLLLLVASLPSTLLARQDCRPTRGANVPELPYGELANDLIAQCNQHGTKSYFAANHGGWLGQWLACPKDGVKCSDILGLKGGRGGDYENLVNQCKSPGADRSKDGKFNGGTFFHVNNWGAKEECGRLTLSPL